MPIEPPAPTAALRPRRTRAAWLAAAAIVAAVVAGCATGPSQGPALVQALRERILAGDLAGADALIARHAGELDDRRALDIAIRAGRADAVRHFLPRAGQDAELDPDATTPLIRAVVDAPSASRPELVDVLVAAGARPDMPDRYGRDARDYATLRNRAELLVRMDPSARPVVDPDAPPAFAAWLAAPAGPAEPPAAATPSRASPPPARGASASARSSGPAARGAATARAPTAARPSPPTAARPSPPTAARPSPPPVLTVPVLLRQPAWRPDEPRADGDRVALRFHVDGIADVLRVPADGGAPAPLPDAHAAWRIDAGTLHVAITGPPFSVRCRGELGRDERLELGCESRTVPARQHGGHSLDLARALLHDDPAARDTAPSLVAIAMGRASPSGDPASARPTDGLGMAAPGGPALERDVRVLPVRLAPAPPAAACRPARVRTPPVAQPARTPGDWHVLDTARFESFAPLSGATCPQERARDAALAECRTAAGAGRAACRSIGGCPAGQASALAGLPGVAGGWVACDASLDAARERALAQCRAALGCDCTLVGLSVRNVEVRAPSSCPAPPAARRPRAATGG